MSFAGQGAPKLRGNTISRFAFHHTMARRLFAGSLGSLLVCIASSSAHGALQVQRNQVNTSAGLLPTSAANKWKLTTDPASPDPIFAQYVFTDGMLDNTYDPTKFTLSTNPGTGTYGLGFSVQGLGAYQVTGFDVQMKGGGYFAVTETAGDPTLDNVKAFGNTTGGESGVVTDVAFQLVASLKNLAGPANVDQDFYQLNLDPINYGPNFDPGIGTTYAGPDSFITAKPINPNSGLPTVTTPDPVNFPNDPGVINPSSSVPEPASISILGAGALGLLARRRRSC